MPINKNSKKDTEMMEKRASMGRSNGKLKRFLHKIRPIVATALAAVLCFWLLSGGINYIKTGQNIVDWTVYHGKKFGNWLASLIDPDTTPFKIEDGGVYFDDADVPDEGAIDLNVPEEE